MVSSPFCMAGWTGGVGMGVGGSGISKEVELDGAKVISERAEQPGMFHIFADRLISENLVFGVEHSRGFQFAPFSSGIGFTSAILRWHYMGPAPEVRPAEKSSQFFLKRWSPYVGGSTGIAFGSIDREGELVKNISASGVFLGLKNGVDYIWRPDFATRIEASYAFTFSKTETIPSAMNEFSLWGGIIMPLSWN